MALLGVKFREGIRMINSWIISVVASSEKVDENDILHYIKINLF